MRLPVLPLVLALALLAACDRPDPVPSADAAPSAERAARADTVIYEVYLRSFTPEGTFRAVIPRLEELQRLGVTTLWLMPIHPVGEVERKGTLGSPYSIRDYTAVNPEFGSMEDFRALVEAVHERGMTVILDLVANHTAWDNPWAESNPEWYVKGPDGAITHPPGTDWTDVAQLDFSNPELRAAMRAAMRFWVEEVGIDGYRADVAEMVPMDFWREAIAELRSVKPVIMLAEGADPELHAAGFDITYAWNTYHVLKEVWGGAPVDTLHAILAAEREAYPPGAGRLRFTTNHDETAWDDTPLALFGGTEGAQAAAVIAFSLPGIPLIYNGQEVGDTQRLPLFEQVPIEWDRDPTMRRFYERLLAERADRPALHRGGYEPVPHAASADVLAFRRAAEGDTALVLVNVRDRGAAVDLPGRGRIELPPYGWRIE
jgi:glycosidase